MNYYETLIDGATYDGFIVKELPLKSGDGRCRGRRVAIRQDIPTLKKKADALAEEIAHGKITVGDISDQTDPSNRRQERLARLMAYEIRFPLMDIVHAFKAHCTNIYEMSEYLDVSEDTIKDAIDFYKQKYGVSTTVDNYIIQFEPYLQVHEFWMSPLK